MFHAVLLVLGRIAGIASVEIQKCYNEGTIELYEKGKTHCGGILGQTAKNKTMNVENCYNRGSIICADGCGYIGGIIGYIVATRFKWNCKEQL